MTEDESTLQCTLQSVCFSPLMWCGVVGGRDSWTHSGDAGETHDEEKELWEERGQKF